MIFLGKPLVILLLCTLPLLSQTEEELDLPQQEDIDTILENIDMVKSEQEAKKELEKKRDDYKFYTEKVYLKEAIIRMLRNSNLIKASVEEVTIGENDYYKSKAEFYPVLSGTASGAMIEKEEDDVEEKNQEILYKVTLTQNLYAGGATLDGYREKKSSYVSKVKTHKGLVEKEVNKAVASYMNVVFQRESLVASEANMKKLEEILELVEIKFENGAVTAGDLNAIKAGVANARNSFVKTKSKYQEAKDYYDYTIGRLGQNALPFENSVEIRLENLDELIEKAYENNSILVAQRYAITAKKKRLDIANSKYLPALDFKLSYTDQETTGDTETTLKELNALFKLTYDFYDGGRREYDVVKTRSAINSLQYRLADKKKKIKWDVSKLYQSIQSLSKTILNSKLEKESSKKVVDSYWNEFKMGSKDLQKLLTAQRDHNRAELSYITARKVRVLDYFTLLYNTGEILDYFGITFYSKLGAAQ